MRDTDPPTLKAGDPRTGGAWAWLVVLATAVVFAPLCAADFTWWDDQSTVHHNPRLNPPTLGGVAHYWANAEGGLYVPLTYTAWAGLAALGRLETPGEDGIALNPWVFHGASVLVHALAAATAFALLRRLVRHDAAAAAGALLFALHPVQVETVGWVSGLKDLLAGCLGLASLLCYVRAAEQERATGRQFREWYALSAVALAAAMLAKPSAVIVPLVAATIDGLILRRRPRRVATAVLPLLALTIPIVLVARLAQDVEAIPAAPAWARPLVFGDALAFYLHKLALPLRLGIDYGRRPDVVMQGWWVYVAWIVPAALAVLLWRARQRRPWLLAGGLIFVVAILPVSGLATFQFQGISTTADHYLYLALLGPGLALAFALREHGGRIAWGIATVALLLLAGRSVVQTSVWQDDLSLLGHAVRVNPRSFAAHSALAQAHARRAADERALAHFARAMTLAPDHPTAFEHAALLHARRGDWRSAADAMEHALEVRPRWPGFDPTRAADDHVRVGQVLLAQGEPARAAAHFEAALRLNPAHGLARGLLTEARAAPELSEGS